MTHCRDPQCDCHRFSSPPWQRPTYAEMIVALTVALNAPPRYFRRQRERIAEWGTEFADGSTADKGYVSCFTDDDALCVAIHFGVDHAAMLGIKHDAVIARELAAGTNTGCVSMSFACELAADALRGEAPLMPPVGWAESDE